MKKPLKFVIITLLIILGLCGVGILYLFFVPGSSLFKITYIHKNATIRSIEYDFETVNEIEINSNRYAVNITNTTNENISAVLKSNSFGFVKTSNQYVKLIEDYDPTSKKLIFNVVEPTGLCTKGKSNLTVYVPENKLLDLTIKNKSSTVTTALSSGSIGDLTYSSSSGSFNFVRGSVHGLIDLDLNKSRFSITGSVDCNYTDVKIKATSGRFNASQSHFGSVEVLKNSRAIININYCSEFEMTCPNAGGKINIAMVTDLQVTTGDTKINFKEVTGEAIIDLKKSGSAHIENFTNEDAISILTVGSGKISVDNCSSRINAYVKTGSLEINNAQKVIYVDSENGNVSVAFAEEATSYSQDKTSRVLYANIKNGSFKATGVEHIGKYQESNQNVSSQELGTCIFVKGSASVNIHMINVLGDNLAYAQSGSIKFVINADESVKYILKTQSEKGSVRVNLSQTPQYNGYTSKELTPTYVNCSNSNNILFVYSVSSSINVFDTNFA